MSTLLRYSTPRLLMQPLELTDAHFIWRLMSDPDWIKYIGDRGVSDVKTAQDYIINGPQLMYRDKGFGILKVICKETEKPIGACGLLQRPALDFPDIGFAFLPEGRGNGYAKESADGLLNIVIGKQLFQCIEAVVSPDNVASIKLLTSLGFVYRCVLPDFDKEKETHAYRLNVLK